MMSSTGLPFSSLRHATTIATTPATTWRTWPRARRRHLHALPAGPREEDGGTFAAADPPLLFRGDNNDDDDEDDGGARASSPLPPPQSSSLLADENKSLALLASAPPPPDDPILASLISQAEASPPQWVAAVTAADAAANLTATATNDNNDDVLMLCRLASWRREFGTSHVPRHVHDAADLGEWLWRQRRDRRRGTLPAWLQAELDALAVDWRPGPEALRWHACYHAARRARDAGWVSLSAAAAGGGRGQHKGRREARQEEEEEEEEEEEPRSLPAGWRAARALASAGDPSSSSSAHKNDDPLHAEAATWLRLQGQLALAPSPGLAPRDGAAATARERREMLRRFGPGLLEARASRASIADAAAMAGLNAHERKLERRRRRVADQQREARREEARAANQAENEAAVARLRAEQERREALRRVAEGESQERGRRRQP
jgi:hypothetical protein